MSFDFDFVKYIGQKMDLEKDKDKLHQFIDPIKHIFSFLYFSETVFGYQSINAMDLYNKHTQEKEFGNSVSAKDIFMGYIMRLNNAWVLIRPTLNDCRNEYGDVLIEIISVPTVSVFLSRDVYVTGYYQYSFDKIISSAKIYVDIRKAEYKTKFNEWEYDLQGVYAKNLGYTCVWGEEDNTGYAQDEEVEIYRKVRFKPVKSDRSGFRELLLANFMSALKNDLPYLNPSNEEDNIKSLFSKDAVNNSVLVRAGFASYFGDIIIAVPGENNRFYYVHQPA